MNADHHDELVELTYAITDLADAFEDEELLRATLRLRKLCRAVRHEPEDSSTIDRDPASNVERMLSQVFQKEPAAKTNPTPPASCNPVTFRPRRRRSSPPFNNAT